jgi:glycosyltransferase involved in cell wall biosynthesis
MRVCHVVEAAGGGVGAVVLDLACAGVAAGDSVTVVYAPARAMPAFMHDLAAINGVQVLTTPMQRSVGLHDAADGYALYQCLANAGPFDVIHAHSSKAGALVRLAGVFLPGAKVYTPHAFMTMDPSASRIYGIIEWFLSFFGDAVVPVSANEARHAMSLGIPASKLSVIPNGVHLAYPATRENARQALGYSENEIVLGAVGRFVPQKNPLRLISAFVPLAENHPELRLALIGDGPLQPEINTAIAKAGLTHAIRCFAGKRGRDVMPGLDALGCSSDYEGFAIVFLEALAAGVPIITTPVGGAEEAVLEGETGFLSPDFTTTNLTAAMKRFLVRGKEAWAAMRKKALQHAKNFDVSVMADKHRALYQRVTQGRA